MNKNQFLKEGQMFSWQKKYNLFLFSNLYGLENRSSKLVGTNKAQWSLSTLVILLTENVPNLTLEIGSCLRQWPTRICKKKKKANLSWFKSPRLVCMEGCKHAVRETCYLCPSWWWEITPNGTTDYCRVLKMSCKQNPRKYQHYGFALSRHTLIISPIWLLDFNMLSTIQDHLRMTFCTWHIDRNSEKHFVHDLAHVSKNFAKNKLSRNLKKKYKLHNFHFTLVYMSDVTLKVDQDHQNWLECVTLYGGYHNAKFHSLSLLVTEESKHSICHSQLQTETHNSFPLKYMPVMKIILCVILSIYQPYKV